MEGIMCFVLLLSNLVTVAVSDEDNLALGKPVISSPSSNTPTMKNYIGHVTDGCTDGRPYGVSCSGCTDSALVNWITVDLGAVFAIRSITIVPRLALPHQIVNFTVSGSQEGPDPTESIRVVCHHEIGQHGTQPRTFPCPDNFMARYVSIDTYYAPREEFLCLTEIIVTPGEIISDESEEILQPCGPNTRNVNVGARTVEKGIFVLESTVDDINSILARSTQSLNTSADKVEFNVKRGQTGASFYVMRLRMKTNGAASIEVVYESPDGEEIVERVNKKHNGSLVKTVLKMCKANVVSMKITVTRDPKTTDMIIQDVFLRTCIDK